MSKHINPDHSLVRSDEIIIRKARRDNYKFCLYCYEANEIEEVYRGHFMFETSGVAACPKLRQDGCPNCHDRGDKAHAADMCKQTAHVWHIRPVRPKMRRAISLRTLLLRKLGRKSWMEVKQVLKSP